MKERVKVIEEKMGGYEMNGYLTLLAILIGILISILLRRKDIKEILKMNREIKRAFKNL